jgi:uncharacterized protein DUF695
VKSPLVILFAFCCQLAVSAGTPEEWSTAVSRRPSDGWQIVARYLDRTILPSEKVRLPVAVSIRWQYNSANGMPSWSTLDAMYEFEDLLEKRLANGAAVLVLVQTGNNSRSWTYFAQSESDFRRAAHLPSLPSSRFPVEITAASDPGWNALERFTKGVRTK